jgi:hypothetical protein
MMKLGFLAVFVLSASGVMAQSGGHQHPATGAQTTGSTGVASDALVADALSAAPPLIAQTAVVKDWDGTVLRPGSDDYTCFPTHPDKRAKGEKEPMCLDKVWLAWGDAWMNKKPFKAEKVGVAYMLAGDTGASNVDPYAEKKTTDNQWIVEGPHVMVLVPDPAQLEAFPTDPKSGGAYVMWKGTPYAHVIWCQSGRVRGCLSSKGGVGAWMAGTTLDEP